MASDFQVSGKNDDALFTLKVHRGDGMALLGMNWKETKPPTNFVGFSIEYKEPGGQQFFSLKNRLCFPDADGSTNPNADSTLQSPIQKFRWVHFPRNAEIDGEFIYKVKPVFMNELDELSYGEPQQVAIELRRETYPGQLNVTFTRGFVSSQAFVDRYQADGAIETLLPAKAKEGLDFTPTHPKAKEALEWMGFEARSAIFEVLDEAIADKKAEVRVVAYDLSQSDFVQKLKKLGKRLKIIIDDSAEHGDEDSGETQAEKILKKSAGENNVLRQHMGNLQHNKTIVVNGPKVKAAVCGSTNYTWRGFYVQANNAVVLRGAKPVNLFMSAFEDYWNNSGAGAFGATTSAKLNDVGLKDIDIRAGFSPYAASNSLIKGIADDIGKKTKSSLLYSLAFLNQTPGVIRDAITKVTNDGDIFVYGIADKKVGNIVELQLQKPDGNAAPVFPAALAKDLPEPFKSEPTGGGGTRMHHKFVVIDFDQPTARVYLGSYNFSKAADSSNGENLLVIRDRRIATSYMIEALRLFDHYHFRVIQAEAKKKGQKLQLKRPPRKPGEKPWFEEDYTNKRRARDRKLFS